MTAKHPGDCPATIGLPCRLCELATRPAHRRLFDDLSGTGTGTAGACVHRGAATGAVVQCVDGCGRGMRLKVFGCAVHGACTLERRGAGVPARCRGCTDWTPRHAIVIEDTANGIGDAVLGLTAVAGVKAAYPDRHIVYSILGEQGTGRPDLLPWVHLFGGYDTLTATPIKAADKAADRGLRVLRPHATYRQQIFEATRKGRWQYYADACGVAPALPPVRPLRDRDTAWAAQYKGAVVLAPYSGGAAQGGPWWSHNNRVWMREKWLLLERLLQRAGHRVLVIDDQARAGRSREFGEVLTEPPPRVAALMLAAACVVGNDSGMTHVAGALGVPAVALCAMIRGEQIFGLYANVRSLNGPLPCTGCHLRGPNFRTACHTVCASIQAIQPEDVALAVREQIERLPALPAHIAAFINRLVVPSPWNRLAPWTDRRETMAAFCRFLRTRPAPLVVETGCQRGDNDWGAGMSTTLLGHVLGGCGGRLVSVDSSPANVAFARKRAGELPISVHQADSRTWLRAYTGPPIDALYLDSADVGTPGYEECCRQEAEAALPHLAADARLLIDDTVRDGDGWRGKGTLAVPWLAARGWTIEREGYQVLLRRQPSLPAAGDVSPGPG